MKNKKYVELEVGMELERKIVRFEEGKTKRVGELGLHKMLLFKIPWDNFNHVI